MKLPRSIRALALTLVASTFVMSCGDSDDGGPTATATVSGLVKAALDGAVIEGATVRIGSATSTTGADGRFELENLPVGTAAITASAPGFEEQTESVSLNAGSNAHDVVLTRQPTATVSGVVTAGAGSVDAGAIAGASVTILDATVTTDADGRFEIQDVPAGNRTISASAPGFASRSESVVLTAGSNTRDLVLTPTGVWELRASLPVNNSELAVAEANGKLYLLGGYPPSRLTSRTVQVYDIANDSWSLGPQLPQPNNHGMAASVGGKIYLIGGQTSDVSELGHVNTVYELDPAAGTWTARAPMPTARSSGVALVHGGRIYVAGGRPPREKDFAVYDPATDSWETLPELPSQRNHMTGAVIGGRIHVVGGRIGHGLGFAKTAVHEVFDPVARTWTTAAALPSSRSGMNGVMARGCFHVWGGESQEGMSPNHDYYDPRTNQWRSLPDMPLPVHGVNGSAFVDGLILVPGGGTQVGGSFGSLHNQAYRPMMTCE
jgi:hypothetical protein